MKCLPLWRGARTLLGLLGLFGLTTAVFAQDSTSSHSPIRGIENANWVATDALGRTLPSYAAVGDPKPNRCVGLFYWQWHGDNRWGPDYNITEF